MLLLIILILPRIHRGGKGGREWKVVSNILVVIVVKLKVGKLECEFMEGFTRRPRKELEQHFQDVAQKVANNKNSESFAAHFTKHFTQKNKSTRMSQNYVF